MHEWLACVVQSHVQSEFPPLGYLNFAINEFCDVKMQPSLERALIHKEILKA
jgi:hypothetical protein